MFSPAKCPYCYSANIVPMGKVWRCRDCQREFDAATVEQEVPEPPVPKRRKK